MILTAITLNTGLRDVLGPSIPRYKTTASPTLSLTKQCIVQSPVRRWRLYDVDNFVIENPLVVWQLMALYSGLCRQAVHIASLLCGRSVNAATPPYLGTCYFVDL
jgi:hypothetical protein